MKPLRHPLMSTGPGHRTPSTMLALYERDQFLREAAHRHCVGMSDRQAAAFLRTKLERYKAGAWRRDQTEDLCPTRHRGTVTEYCWMICKVSEYVPSDRTIRRALLGSR